MFDFTVRVADGAWAGFQDNLGWFFDLLAQGHSWFNGFSTWPGDIRGWILNMNDREFGIALAVYLALGILAGVFLEMSDLEPRTETLPNGRQKYLPARGHPATWQRILRFPAAMVGYGAVVAAMAVVVGWFVALFCAFMAWAIYVIVWLVIGAVMLMVLFFAGFFEFFVRVFQAIPFF